MAMAVMPHLRQALRLVLRSPRVVLFLWALQVLLAAVVATPVHQQAAHHLGRVAGTTVDRAGEEIGIRAAWMLDDWARLAPSAFDSAEQLLLPLLLLSSLFGVLVTAGWMHLALEPKPRHDLRRFLAGGGEHLFAFLRLWILALALYAFATWLLYGAPGLWLQEWLLNGRTVATAADERWAWGVRAVWAVVYLFALLKIEIIVDLARASLVVGQRHSAVSALLRAMLFWLRRWWGALRLVGAGLLLEALWISVCTTAVSWLGMPLWGLALLLPLGRIVLRGSRQAGLALLYQAWITPPSAARARTLDEGTVWAGDVSA